MKGLSTNPQFVMIQIENGNFLSWETRHGCKNNSHQKIVFIHYSYNPVISWVQSVPVPQAHTDTPVIQFARPKGELLIYVICVHTVRFAGEACTPSF